MTVVGKQVVAKLFTRSAARSIMNKRMHNEQNNAAHKMDAGGKWETMNQLGVALREGCRQLVQVLG